MNIDHARRVSSTADFPPRVSYSNEVMERRLMAFFEEQRKSHLKNMAELKSDGGGLSPTTSIACPTFDHWTTRKGYND